MHKELYMLNNGIRIIHLLILLVFFSYCGGETSTPPARDDLIIIDGYSFKTYHGTIREPDVLNERLCLYSSNPQDAPDKIFIPCNLEGGSFSSLTGFETLTGPIKVVGYNCERGRRMDEQIELFRTDPDLAHPDIILLSEADRGCSRSGNRNVIREYARRLEMNYVYGVEYVELPRESEDPDLDIDAACEHGNGILSRYPLGNVELTRHRVNRSWYDSATQPRLGGRMAMVADVLVGSRILHLYDVHFESDLDADPYRAAQAEEIIEHASTKPFSVVVGGDMNTIFYVLDIILNTSLCDPTTRIFLKAGYRDAHQGLPVRERGTSEAGIIGIHGVIDLIFTRGIALVNDRGVCPIGRCGGLSDHMPVWFTFVP